jgi:peptidoglycan hydrolase CwlO-like protein
MAAWIWVLIPIVAILAGTVKEIMQFRSRQERLGTSTHELEETVVELREALDASEKERERLTERVQNLETIVTSQAWDTLQEKPEQRALEDGQRASAGDEEPPPQAGDPEKTEQLARRVQG